MPAVTIKFDRIGRTRNLAPITVDGPTPSDVADLILREVRPYLTSPFVGIAFDRECLQSGDDVMVMEDASEWHGTVTKILGEWS